jgi:hypothetical protein
MPVDPELKSFLEEWRSAKSQAARYGKSTIVSWLILVTVVLILIVGACGITYLATWKVMRQESDARIDRVVNTQPADMRALLLLQSRGGSFTRETVNGQSGKSYGLVMRHGDYPQPWISTDGAAVIPVP